MGNASSVIGQTLEVCDHRIKIRSLLGEGVLLCASATSLWCSSLPAVCACVAGGFSFVFLVQDTRTGQEMVLKRMRVAADNEDAVAVATYVLAYAMPILYAYESSTLLMLSAGARWTSCAACRPTPT
jgi:hypothetical protein